MDITDYTSYNAIRYTIGLSYDELPDATLADEIYQNVLSLATLEVTLPSVLGAGTFSVIFAAITAIAEASRTVPQQKFYDLARLFATYVVADEVCTSLSMSIKMIGDSKSSITRFSPEAAFKDTVKAIKEKLLSIKAQIEGIGSTTVTSLPYSYVIVPDIDPITGE